MLTTWFQGGRLLFGWLVTNEENRDYTTGGGNTPLPLLLKRMEGRMKEEVRG